jgi:exonuclease III
MNGRQETGKGPLSKWADIVKLVNENRIGILAVQETHLDTDDEDTLNDWYKDRVRIINSADPDRPHSSAGVAFVLNKRVTTWFTDNVTYQEIVPGRALALTTNWHRNEMTTIMAVYAPSDIQRHEDFWMDVHNKYVQEGMPSPDFVLGDFNVVEHGLDRMPSRMDLTRATDALSNFKRCLSLQDTWRQTYETKREFTYFSSRSTASRIDRIYTSAEVATEVYDWKTSRTLVSTDHCMVSVSYAPSAAPYIGKGRWTVSPSILMRDDFYEEIIEKGREIEHQMRKLVEKGRRSENVNVQLIWEEFKTWIAALAKKMAKTSTGRTKTAVRNVEKDIRQMSRYRDLDTDHTKQAQLAILDTKRVQLLSRLRRDRDGMTKARYHDKGETPTAEWTRSNKDRQPRDLLKRLRTLEPASNAYVTRSDEMANLAKDFYEKLQENEDGMEQNPLKWVENVECVLGSIPEEQKIRLTHGDSPMADRLPRVTIEKALKLAAGGRATGMDGLPYEIWKSLNAIHERRKGSCKARSFDIVGMMTLVFWDIQEYGVDTKTKFTLGWLCPLYKKNDPTKISNYRPITLLNSDYKLMTRALSLQLADQIDNMIHEDQTGFIPGRSIFSNIRLSQVMIDYAEAMEVDGVIIALDQEKAYDKVDHTYLWRTLDTFGIPEHFIRSVRSLYEEAYTTVIINGVMSETFKVTRGVRQGDPLSCLLFNLAIEPLACMLRMSDKVKGYSIPGMNSKIVLSLFADDTTVYLGKKDKYRDLKEILDLWCSVSGAKFNTDKTEIIPIGSEAHRAEVVERRALNENDSVFDPGVRIVRDGEAVRSLGSWIGNRTNDNAPWETILEKVGADLDRWNRRHPTWLGKRHVVQWIVGGRTQFLAKAQGMPKNIEKRLEKAMMRFVWNDITTYTVSKAQLSLPLHEGGMNLLDVKVRNQAIELMWLKDYLDFSPKRKTWAFVADLLINTVLPEGLNRESIQNIFLQKLNCPTTGKNGTKLPGYLVRMIRAAKSHKVSFAAIKLSNSLKESMPAWVHLGTLPRAYHATRDRCLSETHKVNLVKDLVSMARRISGENTTHKNRRNCACAECKADRTRGCPNPTSCCKVANGILTSMKPKYNMSEPTPDDGLTLTNRRKAANERGRANMAHGGNIVFDPSVTERDSLAECFRAFVDEDTMDNAPAIREQRGISIDDEHITVYTDGSCSHNGKANA